MRNVTRPSLPVRRSLVVRATFLAGILSVTLFADSALAIFDGYKADASKFPWLVTLTWKGSENCGGALIAHDVVLTAAHCVTSQFLPQTQVVYGYKSADPTIVDITRVVENGFVAKSNLNDIAILKVDGQPSSATPINLVAQDPPRGTWLTAIGFGCSSRPYVNRRLRCTRFPSQLMGASMERVREDCRKLSATDFCVYGGHTSLNHGDSGGPVMHHTRAGWHLAGLVDLLASDTVTDDTPPYFDDVTSIAQELRWIKSTLGSDVLASSLTIQGSASFGGMPNPGSLQQAIAHFGQPSAAHDDGEAVDCDVEWKSLGIAAVFQDFGAGATGPCRPERDFNLSDVVLSGSKWVTDQGLRIGDPVSDLTSKYPGAANPPDCATDSVLGSQWWRLVKTPDELGGPGSSICTLAARVEDGHVTHFELSSTAASE
jgi:V8-like Glu-specific endopeptidase